MRSTVVPLVIALAIPLAMLGCPKKRGEPSLDAATSSSSASGVAPVGPPATPEVVCDHIAEAMKKETFQNAELGAEDFAACHSLYHGLETKSARHYACTARCIMTSQLADVMRQCDSLCEAPAKLCSEAADESSKLHCAKFIVDLQASGDEARYKCAATCVDEQSTLPALIACWVSTCAKS